MPRLVEYIIAVGIKRPKVDSTESPELIKRYPREDHKDFPLHPDIVFFCQPEGCSTSSKKISLHQINTFVFTLTDKETSITRFGICCNFFRPCLGAPQNNKKQVEQLSLEGDLIEKKDVNEIDKKRLSLNSLTKKSSLASNLVLCYSLTSICIISSFPFFSTFRECLYVLRKLVESRNNNKKEIFDKLSNDLVDDINQNINQLTLIQCRNWSLLFNNQDYLNSQSINTDILDVDYWIRNLLKIPLPVSGLNRVEVELLPRHIQPPLTFALPESSRFSFSDYPVHLPLELLGVETCLKILTCIMLEHKVVIQSRDYNALSISVMSLTTMLYPLEYMFPIIPLLPTCMKNAEQLLLAPSPFVIGIPSSFFRIKGMSFQVPNDILIVDLDTNKMSVPLSMDEIPSLPEPEGTILKDELNQRFIKIVRKWRAQSRDAALADAYFAMDLMCGFQKRLKVRVNPRRERVDDSWSTLQLINMGKPRLLLQNTIIFIILYYIYIYIYIFFFFFFFYFLACLFSPHSVSDIDGDSSSPLIGRMNERNNNFYGNDIDSVDIAVRCALAKFFMSPNVLGNFMNHTRVLRLYPRPVVALQKEAFIISRPCQSKFIEALAKTQAVEYFAEWMVNPTNTVFKKVEAGIYDPRIIGDKPRWYSHYVQPFYYQVHNPHSHLGSDLVDDSDSDPNFDEPDNIKNGDHDLDEHNACSCCSSFEDSDSEVIDVFGSEDNACDEASLNNNLNHINSKIQELYDTSYSNVLTDQDAEEIKERINTNSVFLTPVYRAEEKGNTYTAELAKNKVHLPEPLIVPRANSFAALTSNDKKSIELVGKMAIGRSLSAVLGSIKSKSGPKSSVSESNSSVVSASNMNSSLKGKPVKLISSRNLEGRRESDITESIRIIEPNDQKIYSSDNQQFLTEVAGYVKSGDGVGWLSTKRLRRILVHEGLRQYLINQLDLDVKDKQVILNDVHISRNVYRGYLELLKLIVEGYENSIIKCGLGGLSSVFHFLEIAHRYYCGKRYHDDSTLTDEPATNGKKSEGLSTGILKDSEDHDSDRSQHFHRDLSFFSKPKINIEKNNKKTSLQNHGSVTQNGASETQNGASETQNGASKTQNGASETQNGASETQNGASVTQNTQIQINSIPIVNGLKKIQTKYLVTKSNTSGGFRYNSGVCEKSTFELAGRGVNGTGRRYLFEGLNHNRTSILWDNMDFWEYSFLDSVASEREAAGMDVNHLELINRYKSLSPQEKHLLEEDEDNLLAVLLHNMIAFMLCMDVSKKEIKRKIRRLLGKSHIGLSQTHWIDNLLDDIDKLEGNDIDLMIPKSRLLKIQIFVVHLGDNQSGTMIFLEVREDSIVLKSTNGNIVEHWWYESVVNMSCSPRTKVVCIWIRAEEETALHKICTRKCKKLYNSIKESMQKAADRLNIRGVGVNLGGNFTVVDNATGQQGKLKVSLEGVDIIFVDKKVSIEISNLKNCCAKDKLLKVEEFLPLDQTIHEHKFFTAQANEICYAILCLFSYVAASKHALTSATGSLASDN
ncbi:MAP kinase-activating death domain protein isoform X2 [Hydra vulgaris]|uniref:MAP kinase-activating death domain protein n=1 Tax=Hydra vulgaris TaxID=6087 RepID=A0ABM4B9X7_HYDVU